ncbi:histidinol-phosphate aminotransferase [Parvularcula bermudensis HTCC2503]|uniref:Histidinol-phosphate aminotransferase n=1 Tax=Parvularcula bermudensis (strain ATCC BAA-594 / HTCC2503 / KCTC 12087) TaxID=314260 RepID=E0TCP8_PARBH|nr:histidinol-phosphate transaminase [Parvularcula bermudensis]ADM08637.1 histidinol-phosphate aminotransferase [Parvularcula bermudensis HTCC2503]
MKTPRPLPGIAEIAPYVPGKGSTHKGVWKLSANESALGASPLAAAAFIDAAKSIHLYPDGDAADLKAAIAEVHGLRKDRLTIGSGSDELISLIIRAYADGTDKVLYSRHGFSYYPVAAAAALVGRLDAREADLTIDVEAMIEAANDPAVKVVFIANPNNPTGTWLSSVEVRRLRSGLRSDVMLVLDGAYAEYIDDHAYSDGADLVTEAEAAGADNVIMIRTFSKIYGLGGLRVGWAYAPLSATDTLNRLRPPFNVGGPSLKAAEAAVRDQAFVAENKAFTDKERRRVAKGLGALGYKVRETATNFVLFEAPGATQEDRDREAQRLIDHLETEGVLVRSPKSSGLIGYLRVTIGPAEANDDFLAAMAAATR